MKSQTSLYLGTFASKFGCLISRYDFETIMKQLKYRSNLFKFQSPEASCELRASRMLLLCCNSKYLTEITMDSKISAALRVYNYVILTSRDTEARPSPVRYLRGI